MTVHPSFQFSVFEFLVSALLVLPPLTAQAEDYTYITANGTIHLTGYTGPGGAVTIPSQIEGLPVTTIGTAFYYCTNLTSVTIPGSVTNIGNSAFYGCSSLTNITLPNSVTSIGFDAFRGCISLSRITVPCSVTYIGGAAFQDCIGLTSMTLPNSITTIGFRMFYGCTGLTNIILPNSVVGIGFWAFNSCSSLKSIIIPNSVRSIPIEGFCYCTSLTTVTIGNGVDYIPAWAFGDCPNLTSVYFQGNAPIHSWFPFQGNTNSTVYYLPGTLGWGPTYADRPTATWCLPYPVILTVGSPSFGVHSNGLGFRISWATNASVVIEASSSLANPAWTPVNTNTLVNGWCDFSDPQWTNYPARFYRLRWP